MSPLLSSSSAHLGRRARDNARKKPAKRRFCSYTVSEENPSVFWEVLCLRSAAYYVYSSPAANCRRVKRWSRGPFYSRGTICHAAINTARRSQAPRERGESSRGDCCVDRDRETAERSLQQICRLAAHLHTHYRQVLRSYACGQTSAGTLYTSYRALPGIDEITASRFQLREGGSGASFHSGSAYQRRKLGVDDADAVRG